jgi:AdoMet-dependent rRNA methyltransferase SPB1
VCSGYLEPAQIDPKLLDAKYVFKEVEEAIKAPNVFGKQPRKPSRIGYESGELIFKKIPVSAFIEAKDPISLLAVNHEFEFDAASQM